MYTHRISWSRPALVVLVLAAVTAAMLSPTCLVGDSSTPAPSGDTAPIIGFRLDDIQNGWCESQQQEVISLFITKNVPLTLGIIGNRLQPEYGTGMTVFLTSPPVQSAIQSGLIEVGSHGFEHPNEGMTAANGWTKDSVQADLTKCANLIKSTKILDAAPSVFIPPENDYDDSVTEEGARAAGITAMSAQCDVNPSGNPTYCPGPGAENIKAPALTDEAGINQVAAGAVLDSWTDFQAPGDIAAAQGWVQRQVTRQGFSVFMLHPQEFTTDGAGCSTIDQGKLNQLATLLDDYVQAGAKLETLSGVVKAVGGGV